MESTDKNQKKNVENVESIGFSADITNEEALIFQLLKKKQNIKLICPEAKAYQKFLQAYSSCSGSHVFKGDLDRLALSDMVISFGVWFEDKSTASIRSLCQSVVEKESRFVYMHSIEEAELQSSITQFIKYEVGSEEGVAALLAATLLEDKALPENVEEILEEFDIGYLSAESNVGEEELESMYESIDETEKLSLVIGSDLYTHPKAAQIAKLIALLERHAGINVVCVPPEKNALGVALICDLDDTVEGRHTVYQSCKEGTYVNVDKCVTMNEKMQLSDINGLNTLAESVGVHGKNLMDFSNQLPQNKGFQTVGDRFNKDCLYKLALQETTEAFDLDEIDDLPVYDGALVYTYKVEKTTAKERHMPGLLYGSKQFSMATKLQDDDVISFEVEGVKFTCVFKIDTHMKGVIALNPVFDIKLSASLLSSYRFSRLAFEKIHNQKIGNNDE